MSAMDDLVRWEGIVPWLYRDSAVAGNVTIGVGLLVPDEKACIALPLVRRDGTMATTEEKSAAWESVRCLPAGLGCQRYRKASPLRLPLDSIKDLVARKLEAFQRVLRADIKGYDAFPEPAKRALLDMIWSLGRGKLSLYVKMLDAAERHDWHTAAKHCTRVGARAKRNKWVSDLFLEAARGTVEPQA